MAMPRAFVGKLSSAAARNRRGTVQLGKGPRYAFTMIVLISGVHEQLFVLVVAVTVLHAVDNHEAKPSRYLRES